MNRDHLTRRLITLPFLALAFTGGCKGIVDSRSSAPVIAFAVYPANSTLRSDIYLISEDGLVHRRLTEFASGAATEPAWSPDGRRIAFTYWDAVSPDGTVPDDSLAIYVMNADGTGITRITHGPDGSASPAWSPDGRRIAFATVRGGIRNIAVMNANGSGRVALPNAGIARPGAPSWSPDASHLIVATWSRGILRVPLDGSAATRWFDDACGHSPRWSADGSRVAYGSCHTDADRVAVRNADGSGRREFAVAARTVSWAPDGRRIVTDDWMDAPFDLQVIDIETGAVRNLTQGAYRYSLYPDWRPRR